MYISLFVYTECGTLYSETMLLDNIRHEHRLLNPRKARSHEAKFETRERYFEFLRHKHREWRVLKSWISNNLFEVCFETEDEVMS